MAIERLYENESLTDNLTDQDAKALLEWAQQQIISNTEGEMVTAAVSAANASGEQGVQALLTQASTFLAQELTVRGMNTARAQVAESSPPTEVKDSMREGTRTPETAKMDTVPPASLQASGEISNARVLTGRADASIAPETVAPKIGAKKSRRKAKTKKTKTS